MINVKHVDTDQELNEAFFIREKVYIEEQQIDRADEFDEFDKTSEHFIAHEAEVPCGTGRYRETTEGIKLERFAVLPEFRKRGIASLIIESMLEHIKVNRTGEVKLYLNAQLSAMPLYSKFNFKPEGERFLECDIEHQKMSRTL
ncbi:MAG: GNAT family N-acetyltransferase [Fulvivirga sp.]